MCTCVEGCGLRSGVRAHLLHGAVRYLRACQCGATSDCLLVATSLVLGRYRNSGIPKFTRFQVRGVRVAPTAKPGWRHRGATGIRVTDPSRGPGHRRRLSRASTAQRPGPAMPGPHPGQRSALIRVRHAHLSPRAGPVNRPGPDADSEYKRPAGLLGGAAPGRLRLRVRVLA